ELDDLFREVDNKAHFKGTVIESAFVMFDKKNNNRMSKAAKISVDEWAKQCRQSMRDYLQKINKKHVSQQWRDKKAKETEPEDTASKDDNNTKQAKISSTKQDKKEVPTPTPSTSKPSSLPKYIEVP
ncbi:unnamed protein product, partial [Polarella glacialis]